MKLCNLKIKNSNWKKIPQRSWLANCVQDKNLILNFRLMPSVHFNLSIKIKHSLKIAHFQTIQIISIHNDVQSEIH